MFISLSLLVFLSHYFLYIDNRRLHADKRLPILSYLKILLVTAVLTYIVLYIRTRKFDIPKLKSGGATVASPVQVSITRSYD